MISKSGCTSSGKGDYFLPEELVNTGFGPCLTKNILATYVNNHVSL